MTEVAAEMAGKPGTLKIAIVGAGAVGSYYGGILSHAGEDVHFLLRSDYTHVKQHGLKIIRHGRDTITLRPPIYQHTQDIGHVDLIIIAAKATANQALNEIVTPLIGNHTALLTLQNGMGNVEHWAKLCGDNSRIMAGLCFVCINRTAPGIIENYMPGSITLAEAAGTSNKRTQDIAARLLRAGSPIRIADNLAQALWKKLIWNIPFNGLTIAAGGIDCGQILANQTLANQVHALMHEVQAAAAAEGHPITQQFIQKQIDITYPMKNYKPSSLIDYLEGKPVEVQAIWGEPLRRAKTAGIATPKLELLHAILQTITKKPTN